jgi:hypothetical protein
MLRAFVCAFEGLLPEKSDNEPGIDHSVSPLSTKGAKCEAQE